MAKKPDLDGAYALGSKDAVRSLYADWADTYDSGFVTEHGYQLHQHVADGFVALGGTGPVLDVGAGTGLVGEALAKHAIGPIDGTDLSAEMLDIARAKTVYRDLFTGDILGQLDVEVGSYAGVVSAGTFTLGHVGPQALHEVVRVLALNGLACLSVNAHHWSEAGFDDVMAGLAGQIIDIHQAPCRIYAQGATHDHAEDSGVILSFRRRV